jgi:hypothetical protein
MWPCDRESYDREVEWSEEQESTARGGGSRSQFFIGSCRARTLTNTAPTFVSTRVEAD